MKCGITLVRQMNEDALRSLEERLAKAEARIAELEHARNVERGTSWPKYDYVICANCGHAYPSGSGHVCMTNKWWLNPVTCGTAITTQPGNGPTLDREPGC